MATSDAVAKGVGTRIRQQRLDRKIRQADLAEAAGISPSYLNLIEHGRRRIGGQLLAGIAQALGVEAARLADGAEREVIDRMRQAASEIETAAAEIGRAEDLAARYPGWAEVIVAQTRRIAALERQVQLMADRLTYDPELATVLHRVITAVTAIRSSATILTGDDPLDSDWQRRFARNILADAVRLADDSNALVAYLDAPGDDVTGVPLTPVEQVERWLGQRSFHVAALEEGGDPAEVAAGSGLAGPAGDVLRHWLQRYGSDAAAVPMADLSDAARAADHDPVATARALGRPLPVVLRRMASLRAEDGHPDFGLAICDAGGFALLLKETGGFVLPRGTACPLWPVFTALGQPGRPALARVAVPGQPEALMDCVAVAEQAIPPGSVLPPLLEAVMLVRTDPPAAETGAAPVPVGMSCRICPRGDCPARREPSALGAAPR